MMKRFIAVFLCLGLLFSAALADDVSVTVNGTGTVTVAADNAVINLGCVTVSGDVRAAQASVNSAIAAIRAALTENGIGKEDINTGSINIYPVYDYSSGEESISGYSVSSLLAIRVTDVTRVGEIIDLAFQAGANRLDNISFSAADTRQAEEMAMKLAVEDAVRKAKVLCAAAGLGYVGITEIRESYTGSYDSGLNNFTKEAAMGARDTVVQNAGLAVTASVTLECEAR